MTTSIQYAVENSITEAIESYNWKKYGYLVIS